MVKSGQHGIRPVSFASQRHPGLPVEVVARSELIDRMGVDHFARPDRPAFDIVMLIHHGSGTHTIDFQTVRLLPGRLIRIRPGQVQSWDVYADVDATLVLSQTATQTVAPWRQRIDASCDLGAGSLRTALSIVDVLRAEQQRYGDDEPSTRLMIRLFEALDALFDRAQPTPSGVQLPEPYIAFRTAIEANLGDSHIVRDYAADIGYSQRTITRACQRVTGLTAKGVLTQRLILEAKRLLAHTDQPAAAIGNRLGFSEATNFHKFFRRNTGQSPVRFRAATRLSA